MKDKIKLFLDWALPTMCLINLIAFWGDTSLMAAWTVAFAGWSSNLINRYKKA